MPPPRLAGRVATRKVRVVLAIGAELGVPRAELLVAARLSERDLQEEEGWVPQAAWGAVWDALADRVGDPAVALKAAAHIDRGYFGVIDYGVRSCPTVREAVPLAARYFRLANTWGRVEVEDLDGGLRVSRHILGDEGMQLPRQAAEFALTAMVRLFRLATAGPFPLAGVSFRHPAPADDASFRAYFGAPITWGAPRDAVVLPPSTLAVRMAAPDARLRTLVESWAADALARVDDELELLARVRHEVARRLHVGPPRLSEVGRRLGMSPRTLQRRLTAKGHTYRELVDGLRRERGTRLVGQGMAPGEVAFLTGFSEVSAFHRAFRGWTGTTPGRWRATA